MTIITPKAQETSNGSLLNAYKTKEEVEKLRSANYKLFQFAAKEILHQDEQVT